MKIHMTGSMKKRTKNLIFQNVAIKRKITKYRLSSEFEIVTRSKRIYGTIDFSNEKKIYIYYP